jgi:hypothetical protein
MERTLISFNLPNIITITLMAALGYMLLAVVAQVMQSRGISVS